MEETTIKKYKVARVWKLEVTTVWQQSHPLMYTLCSQNYQDSNMLCRTATCYGHSRRPVDFVISVNGKIPGPEF